MGGTKIEAILIDEFFNVVDRKRVSTPNTNYNSILSTISSLVTDISVDISDYTLGVCTPGTISKQTGLIKNSNTQCLIGKPIKTDLENMLNLNISLENDANCFALAESKFGSAQGYDVVFGIIMGTGIGGGLVIDGKLVSGRNHISGEWGHHTLHQNGRPCYCGKKGCVETYLSGPSLEKYWSTLTGKSQTLSEIISNFVYDEKSVKWRDEFLENFGYGVANVIDILDPDAIVIGGGLSNIGFLYTEGKDSVYEKVFSDSIDTPILQNKLGDSAGVFGAALLI